MQLNQQVLLARILDQSNQNYLNKGPVHLYMRQITLFLRSALALAFSNTSTISL